MSKLRPALLLAKLPGDYDDWLICMISSQLNQCVEGLDEIIGKDSPDFIQSGLKTDSVVRISRIAVAASNILLGSIGDISPELLIRIKNKLADWIKTTA
ncbi:MAG: type II toxin-antitoxin system PemK/MazF family toxin [Candidatus Schekmanbacteria bacterium]|nr:type II toxin-antitoxin system PemK/MazF family toxin [Candidatus Schekmanbacteria bacterium]